MLNYIVSNSNVGVLSCKLEYPDGSFQESARKFISFKYMFFSRMSTWNIYHKNKILDEYIMSKPYDNEEKEVDWVLGACMLIPRSIFFEIGMFDERFKLYAEDADLCYRVIKNGYKVIYLPSVSLTHIYARKAAKNIFSKASFLQLYTAVLFYVKNYLRLIK